MSVLPRTGVRATDRALGFVNLSHVGSRETKSSDQNDRWRRLEKERTGRTEFGWGGGGVGGTVFLDPMA